jgi:riboflavin kinase/FMN adenylyltransferase
MNVIGAAADLNPGPGGVSLAIGVFDGIHLGHQSVIGRAREDARDHGAKSVVITFDRHPNSVVAPQSVPPLIYPLSQKLRLIESLGLDTACVIHFDKAFSQISGETFVRDLARHGGPVRSICVGETFLFGCRRSGNVELLQKLAVELGFQVRAVPDLSLNGQPISSTRIREAIRSGNFDSASQMLGRAYSLCGKVIAGEKVGRKLGFPTANLDIEGIVTPPTGVYVAEAQTGGGSYRAAVNIGHRPTVHSAPRPCVEAHLLDFSGDLYGQEIKLTFLKKLREEHKFPSIEALRQQISQDVAAARAA